MGKTVWTDVYHPRVTKPGEVLGWWVRGPDRAGPAGAMRAARGRARDRGVTRRRELPGAVRTDAVKAAGRGGGDSRSGGP